MRRSSRHSLTPYALLISMLNTEKSASHAATRVRLARPLPPTPTSSALPPGCRSTRLMRHTCCAAYWNRTKSMRLLLCALYSASRSSITASRRASSATSA